MNGSEIFGAWVAVFLTLGIFSYLYKDNPFYKIAEHVFVGVSAGYWMSMFFWTQIQPNLFGRLWPVPEGTISGFFMRTWYGIYNLFGSILPSVFPDGGIDKGHGTHPHFIYIIPFVLGVMMLLSVVSKWSWFARLGIAYTVGMAAGLRAYAFLNSNVLGQLKGSAVSFVGLDWFSLTDASIINNIIILIGTITGLLYFYFSKEHKGNFGKVTRVGIYFLMISFGASFGFAVMGRISLLIGRFTDLISYGGPTYNYASLWVLLLMVILLAVWTFKSEKKVAS
ncbi:MAG: hypothetical protein H8E26_15020 [FCB group bacterium]|nr:hypothetical protein [FCB group bacterium]MBL7026824.1 hypothetical protein [Candidatus Neomarinimicrobiota bacterium]MBL7121401.1 hypothetical protein [Candidatus Neomarinimicrobiota bacterium]